ncbi:MAG: LapA family protein [Deltaproteobacteria bacterium]|nr:LapA family protein [Deltaproteobacteria bacterium]
MQYIKTLMIIIVLFSLIIFGVSNTQSFVLSFLDYELIIPVEMWLLLMMFFFAGMIPIFIIGLPEKSATYKQLKALNKKIKQIENDLASIDQKPSLSDSD